jgi:hypothetical protein
MRLTLIFDIKKMKENEKENENENKIYETEKIDLS